MFFDIHSHILPCVDDGARDINESIELLNQMQSQGITHVIATPHFYPQEDNLNDFSEKISLAFIELEKKALEMDLPRIYLGCEMLYFRGIGSSSSLPELCLNGSYYLLLELTDDCIDDTLFNDIREMRKNLGITPIIAHIERYFKAKNYRKLLKFIKAEKIPAQINASSFFIPAYNRTMAKLIKSGIAYTIATDSHSVDVRPPMLAQALRVISTKFGRSYRLRLIKNSQILFEKIVSEGEFFNA